MDSEITDRIFQQVMSLWIKPEINKRKSLKRLPKNFNLRAAQIIFSLDRGWNKVRLNNEIKAEANLKLRVSKNKGDPIYEHEVENIQSIELTNKDPNCAHITLLKIRGKWIISFDFRYNKKRVLEHIERAKEFFDSAKENISNKRFGPFFENAFACAELLAKSILLQLPDKKMLHEKDHNLIIEKFKNFVVLGNVKIEHSNVLEKLKKLRSSARYVCSTDFKREDTNEIIKNLEEMMEIAERIEKRIEKDK